MRVRISVAADFSPDYKYPRTYEVRGEKPTDVMAEVQYAVPTPLFGSWFSLKIEFLDALGATVNVTTLRPIVLRRVGLELQPKLPTQESSSRSNLANRSRI